MASSRARPAAAVLAALVVAVVAAPEAALAAVVRERAVVGHGALARGASSAPSFEDKYAELMEYYARAGAGARADGEDEDDLGLTDDVVFRVASSTPGGIDRAAAAIASRHGLLAPVRAFRHAGRFEAAHRAAGLHMWYTARAAPAGTNSRLGRMVASLAGMLTDEGPAVADVAAIRPTAARAGLEVVPRGAAAGAAAAAAAAGAPLLPHDPLYSLQAVQADMLRLEAAWALSTGGPDVVVSVVDAGVDEMHPDLLANLWRNPGEVCGNMVDDDGNGYVDDCHGYDFALDTGLKQKTHGDSHGTHVAGTIAASTDNGVGVAGVAGGGPGSAGARVMSCVVFGEQGNAANFHEAIVYGADNGAAISNNSWGFTRPGVSDPAVLEAIDYFNARAAGALVEGGGFVVFAAGNSGSQAAFYPAYYSGAIAVASVDVGNVRAGYSNYGDWVDIAAPGTNVLSTVNVEYGSDAAGSYGLETGTSMASPQVSGVLALMISRRRGLPRASYLDCLFGTALPTRPGPFPLGAGLVQADAAVACLPGPPDAPDSQAPAPAVPAACAARCDHAITVSVQTDGYPQETSWRIVAAGDDECEVALRPASRNIASGGPFAPFPPAAGGPVYTERVAGLCSGESYNVVVFDNYGDGLCCSGGGGFFVIAVDDVVVRSGARFDSIVETLVRIPGAGVEPSLRDCGVSWTAWSACDAACASGGAAWDGVLRADARALGDEIAAAVGARGAGASFCDLARAAAARDVLLRAVPLLAAAAAGCANLPSPAGAGLAAVSRQAVRSKSRLSALFASFDADGDALLDREELAAAAAALGGAPPGPARGRGRAHASVARAAAGARAPAAARLWQEVGARTRRLLSTTGAGCADVLERLFPFYYENDLAGDQDSPLVSWSACAVTCGEEEEAPPPPPPGGGGTGFFS